MNNGWRRLVGLLGAAVGLIVMDVILFASIPVSHNNPTTLARVMTAACALAWMWAGMLLATRLYDWRKRRQQREG